MSYDWSLDVIDLCGKSEIMFPRIIHASMQLQMLSELWSSVTSPGGLFQICVFVQYRTSRRAYVPAPFGCCLSSFDDYVQMFYRSDFVCLLSAFCSLWLLGALHLWLAAHGDSTNRLGTSRLFSYVVFSSLWQLCTQASRSNIVGSRMQ